MGLIYFGIPRYLAAGLRDSLSLTSFIETGTNTAQTCEWAANNFQHVVSIEADEQLHYSARAKLGSKPNVDLRLGRSEVVLRSIVPTLERPAMFWLDAHWCGEGTAGGDTYCPVLEEISIVDSGAYQHVLLIDDARMFLNLAPFRPDQWPTSHQLLDVLRRRFPNTYIAIQDDVILRVPLDACQIAESLLKSRSELPAVLSQRYHIAYSLGGKS